MTQWISISTIQACAGPVPKRHCTNPAGASANASTSVFFDASATIFARIQSIKVLPPKDSIAEEPSSSWRQPDSTFSLAIEECKSMQKHAKTVIRVLTQIQNSAQIERDRSICQHDERLVGKVKIPKAEGTHRHPWRSPERGSYHLS